LKIAAFLGCLLGLALLITLVVRADFSAILVTLASGGWELLWLAPYRALYFVLYAIGWLLLLRPYDPQRRADFGYLFWATTVREAVDRLLPVASVGGSVVGVRLLRWRGIEPAPAAASVIVEIVLTLIVIYLFAALGALLLVELSTAGPDYHRLLLAFLLTLPVPLVSVLLLRYGSVFVRLQKILQPLVAPLMGDGSLSARAAALDRELRATLHRSKALLTAGGFEFAAMLFGSFEIWFALRLFGHPVDAGVAVVLESLTQAVRHIAFVIPAGLGVQEAGLVLFGQAFGIGSELALAVSMAKRMREILCGLPALISWQLSEGRRIHRSLREASR
jgi:putative membrane protein